MSSNLVYRLSDYLVQQSWQIAVLILLVALLNQALRNRSAHLRSMLWLIVLAKCLVPPMFSIPLAVLPTKAVEQLVVQESESSFSVLADEVPADPPTEVSSSIAPALTWVDRFQSYVQGHSMILLWALVVAAFYGIVLIRALRIRSRLYRDRQLAPPQLQAELESISKRMGRSKCPQAWLIGDVGQPFVWGWCKGTVYLPQDFFELNSAEFRQAILAHELSHMHRLDPGVNLIQLIAQGLFWFHPLVWWANSQLRQEREKCCDERVLAHLGIATRDYCQALIDTLARASRVTAPLGSLAISGPVKHVESRIQTMMNAKRRFAKGPKRLATITTAVLALFVVPMTFALTEKPIEENQSESTPIGFDRDRILSAENMKRLGPIIWELVDGQDQVLVHIEQLREHCPEDLLRWARESVRLNRELLRKPILGSVLDPIPVVAYDHDLMKQGRGTNALYLDLHVDFINTEDLHELSAFIREELVRIDTWVPAESNEVQALMVQPNKPLVPNGGLALQYLTSEAIDRIHGSLNSRLIALPVVVVSDGKEASMAVIKEEYFMLGKSETTTDLAHFEIEWMAKIRPNIVSETNEIMLRIEMEISELPDLEIPEGILPVVTRRTSSNRMTLEAGHGVFVSFPSVHGRTHHLIIEARRLTVLESLLRQSAYKEN